MENNQSVNVSLKKLSAFLLLKSQLFENMPAIQKLPVLLSEVENLPDLLYLRSRESGEKGFYFIDKDTAENDFLSFRKLETDARKIAAELREQMPAGERVLLLYPQGLDYISAFFGCLYAGVVAVPTYLPGNNRNLERLVSIIENSSAKFALTNKTYFQNIQKSFNDDLGNKFVKFILSDEIESVDTDFQPPKMSGADVAFLQYTSGSTKQPRGVMVTHQNLLHNSKLLKQAFNYHPESHCVSWLPMYHDMGLIGGILQPLFGGYSCTLMSPAAFLQSPVRWLQIISGKKGTISGAPNFGYELCVKKITGEQMENIDLRSWEVAFNGAEPVNAQTMKSFADKFAPCGFDHRALFPCYGLAEATLFVSGGAYQTGAKICELDAVKFAANEIEESSNETKKIKEAVSSGRLYEKDQKVVIVENETRQPVAENRIGEIWISGESVAKGYWNNSSETEKVFNLNLNGNSNKDFLATGDLGFIKDGELFVTGRIKDLIIIRGVNHYPQDIEKTVTDTDPAALTPNGCAAFSVMRIDEVLTVVVEIRHPKKLDLDNLISDIRRNVTKTHGIEIGEILFTKAAKIPKTTSGKIQRAKCREQYLNSELPEIKKWSVYSNPEDQKILFEEKLPERFFPNINEQIYSAIKKEFGIETKHDRINLTELDSLKITELLHIIEENTGVEITFSEIYQMETLGDLFELVRQREKSNGFKHRISEPFTNSDNEEKKLSYGQKGFLFLHQFYKEVSPDNIFIAAEIKHKIDDAHLEKSLEKIIEKHEVLRTRYRENSYRYDTEPFESKSESLDICVVKDLSDKELREVISDEIYKPFDIAKSLFSFKLYRRKDDDSVLLLKFHHSIADYWSLRIIAQDLLEFYDDFANNRTPVIAERANKYSDFANWQRSFAESRKGLDSLNFWKERLGNKLPFLSLPIGKPFVKENTFRGDNYNFGFDAELTSRIKAFSKDSKVSIYTTLLASYFALLFRYTGQEEQIIGSPFSGRISGKWAETAGYFVNLMPVRLKLNKSDGFADIQKNLHREILKITENQNYPFNLLVEKIKPERAAGKNPVFQTMFVFQNKSEINDFSLAEFSLGISGGKVSSGNLTLESFEIKNKAAQFELSVYLAENDKGIKGKIEFNSGLFNAEAIEKFALYWERLLEQALKNPALKINLLEIVTENDLQKIVAAKPEVSQVKNGEQLIDRIFENQAAKTPEKIALICGDKKMTYHELNRRADELAEHLKNRGIGAEDLVGICLPRDENLVISILAVLKSGGGYVPLDANYPDERLSYISSESNIKLLITKKNQNTVWANESIEKVLIDGDLTENNEVKNRKDSDVNSKLAYVIYTSGSTGKPKGVAIEHRSVVSFLDWSLRQFSAENLSRTLASTSINFDLSIFELFAPLSCGGTIVLVENALFLQEVAESSKITLINTVPSTMNELLKLNLIPEKVQIINLAGEPLKKTLVSKLYETTQVEKVFNLYGPSEDTTYTTFEMVSRDDEKVTIGRSIDKTRIYLLNEDLQLVPEGAVGEVYIGGEGLARGYFQRSDLTAEKFLPNPFAGNDGARMYATGDLAKYLPDGKLDYLGRKDNQVKVRGFRIELGEIETALSRHPHIREAAVITKENKNNELELIAYLIPAGETDAISTTSIRSYLKQKLPDYMIPQYFLPLENLPLTSNKKIDRLALAKLDVRFEKPEQNGTAPQNIYQQKIVEIWKDVLSRECVNIEDNFFELGGTSLLITRVASRLKETFQVEFTLQEIYDCFTVKKQAELIEELKKNSIAVLKTSKIKSVSRTSRKIGSLSD